MAKAPQKTSEKILAEAKARRSLYEIFLQLATTLLIPLSVAGMGWYYTRWQQNLNDLKTMIELVTDEKVERRKYGIAMFEYLLKNDKVPVEFVSAQLNFANASSDPTLIVQMEQALNKAAAVNPTVATSFKEAMARLPSRLFISVRNLNESRCIRRLITGFKDGDRAEISIPSVAVTPEYGAQYHEMRYFKEADKDQAVNLIRLFGTLGLEVKLKDFTTYSGAHDFRPNTFELWIGQAQLPPICSIE